MQVIRSELLGFCMGVSRAVKMAQRVLQTRRVCKTGDSDSLETVSGVYTMGPLIHNPRVLEDLGKSGIKILKEGEIPPRNSTVIIRAHGISPLVETALLAEKVNILDATCPYVKANQKTARDYAEKGYWVFLAGEKNHGEIIGIRSYVKGARCSVAADPAEAEAAAAKLFISSEAARTVLIGQTTISAEEYRIIGESIMRFFPSLKIIDTICKVAAERQKALRELCGRVDAVIIAGGRDSANTRRLQSLAEEMGKPAWIAESPEDLPAEIAGCKTVGLCSGASAPDDLITGIEEALKAINAV